MGENCLGPPDGNVRHELTGTELGGGGVQWGGYHQVLSAFRGNLDVEYPASVVNCRLDEDHL